MANEPTRSAASYQIKVVAWLGGILAVYGFHDLFEDDKRGETSHASAV